MSASTPHCLGWPSRRGWARTNAAAQALGRQALQAGMLELPSPATGQRIRMEEPLPEDFLRALAVLRGGRARRASRGTEARRSLAQGDCVPWTVAAMTLPAAFLHSTLQRI